MAPNIAHAKQLRIVKTGWETKFKKGWGGGEDALFNAFLKKFNKSLGKKILDIGFGEGRHLVPLAKAGFEMHGIELTETGLATVKKALRANALRANVQQGDNHALPFENGTFDAVLSIQVFQFNDWQGAKLSFSEAGRVLKKGGLLYLRVKSSAAKIPAGQERIKDERGKTYRTEEGALAHVYTLPELRTLGAQNKLKIIGKPIDKENTDSRKVIRGQWSVIFRKMS